MSRQAIYDRLAPAVEPDHVVVTVEPVLRLVPPVLPEDWTSMALGPPHRDVETAIHVLVLRHPGRVSQDHRPGTAGRLPAEPQGDRPAAEGVRVPADTQEAPPEDAGQAVRHHRVEPAVADRHDQHLVRRGGLGLLHRRHRLLRPGPAGLVVHPALPSDRLQPSLEMGWSTAFQYSRDEDDPKVACRHDNRAQFTSVHYRGVAKDLNIVLSRTAYRHPDGNALSIGCSAP